jgi:hypothetical protein
MSTWSDEYLQMVTDCENRESRVNDWERGFLDGVRYRLESGEGISPRQIETLDRIWERVTADG